MCLRRRDSFLGYILNTENKKPSVQSERWVIFTRKYVYTDVVNVQPLWLYRKPIDHGRKEVDEVNGKQLKMQEVRQWKMSDRLRRNVQLVRRDLR